MGRKLKYTDRYCVYRNFCTESQYICCFFCKKAKCNFRCKDYDKEKGCALAVDYDKSQIEVHGILKRNKNEVKNES